MYPFACGYPIAQHYLLKKKVYFSINFLKIFIYFSFLAPLGLAVCGLSPVVVSRRNSLVSHCFS